MTIKKSFMPVLCIMLVGQSSLLSMYRSGFSRSLSDAIPTPSLSQHAENPAAAEFQRNAALRSRVNQEKLQNLFERERANKFADSKPWTEQKMYTGGIFRGTRPNLFRATPPLLAQEHLMSRADAASILGVDSKASEQEVKAAYHAMVKKYHPDVVGEQSTEKMKEIIQAYEFLKDQSPTKVREVNEEEEDQSQTNVRETREEKDAEMKNVMYVYDTFAIINAWLKLIIFGAAVTGGVLITRLDKDGWGSDIAKKTMKYVLSGVSSPWSTPPLIEDIKGSSLYLDRRPSIQHRIDLAMDRADEKTLNSKDGSGLTALTWAIIKKDTKTIDALLKRRKGKVLIDVNLADNQGRTPLMYAMKYGLGVEQLLSAGADVNQADALGNTALSYAIIRKDLPAVLAISRQGLADVHQANHQGVTPFMLARAFKTDVFKDIFSRDERDHMNDEAMLALLESLKE